MTKILLVQGANLTFLGRRDLAIFVSFFFFQAEDGIRGLYVTGVQTCALPISLDAGTGEYRKAPALHGLHGSRSGRTGVLGPGQGGSGERGVGKESGIWWG